MDRQGLSLEAEAVVDVCDQVFEDASGLLDLLQGLALFLRELAMQPVLQEVAPARDQRDGGLEIVDEGIGPELFGGGELVLAGGHGLGSGALLALALVEAGKVSGHL